MALSDKTYWEYLNYLIDKVVEAEDRPTYTLEMDVRYLPVLASVALHGDASSYPYIPTVSKEEDCLSDLHMFAANDYMLPSSLEDASFDDINAYIKENREEILDKIRHIFEDYYDEYYK